MKYLPPHNAIEIKLIFTNKKYPAGTHLLEKPTSVATKEKNLGTLIMIMGLIKLVLVKVSYFF